MLLTNKRIIPLTTLNNKHGDNKQLTNQLVNTTTCNLSSKHHPSIVQQMRKGTKTLIALGVLLAAVQVHGVQAQATYAEHSLLAEGRWYKIPVSETGVYKITAGDIAGLSGTECSHIALYGADAGMLTSSNNQPRPDDLKPVALEMVDANGNGIFDEGDCLMFYGEGANVWRYNNPEQAFQFNMHAYANYNYYYLTPDHTPAAADADTLRIRPAVLPDNMRPDINTTTATALYHEDRINSHGGGQIWAADKFTPSLTTRTYKLQLPGNPSYGTVSARYAFANVSDYAAEIEVTIGDTKYRHTYTTGNYYYVFSNTFNTRQQEVEVTVRYIPHDNNATGYLDFIELNTFVPLTYSGSQLTVRNQQQILSGCKSRFVVRGNGNGLRAWDITSPDQPRSLAVSVPAEGSIAFEGATDKARSFVLFGTNDLLSPTGIVALENQDIHGSEVPDMVIVTHKNYKGQGERIGDLHLLHDGMNSLVVTQEEVFNEFSGGRPDPMAIRQMMRCLRHKAGNGTNDAPRYLLLLGKGTYDNRDLLGNGLSTVITYETPASFNSEGNVFPSDDVYGYLDDATSGVFEGSMSVGIGRLPAKSNAEADHMIDKIEGYLTRRDLESDQVRGDWRNYVALLADDADPSSPGDTNFASDSEITARQIKELYPHYNIDRIYADAYVQQSGADGSYYPDVNNALRQRMNYGCLLLNYIGHGSGSYIGTERYMEFQDIEQYTNTDRLTFFVTSTCTFGKYDQIDALCGSEAFMLARAAGIGVVAAARPIHHVQRFNTLLCLYALDGNNSIGDALRMAKNASQVSHCITLMGDPAIHLSVPRNRVVVTRINQRPVNPEVTDSAEVLSRVTVEGEIQGSDGERLEGFDGTIYPIVFDREMKYHTLANDNDSTEIEFVQQKNVLYKGREKVEGGRFEYSFIVPRDVAYRYDYGKLSHYARSGNNDATGQYSNIMFGGFNEETTIDELYPTVRLYINDTNFRNGGLTNESPTLIALLSDSVGINTAGSGLGHGITATLDGNPFSMVTLNDFFEPDLTDGRNGTVTYTMGKLDNGPHTLTLKCWNIFNYSGSASVDFYVVNDRTAEIGNFAAAPNPAHHRTTLRVEHNLTDCIANATLEIYDMRGRLLRTATPTAGSSVVRYDWDFTNGNGAEVAKGIYVARVTLITTRGEKLTKMTKIVRN